MPERTGKALNRTLTNLHHGDHAVPTATTPRNTVANIAAETASLEAVTQNAAPECLDAETTPFDYLFDDLRDHYPDGHLPVDTPSQVVAALKALGSAMVDAPQDAAATDSTIPPVYTYWGQFVDHDVTANTDREGAVAITTDPLTPLEPAFVTALVRNLREPALNLDSVYGNGPGDPHVAYDGIKLDPGTLQVLVGAPFTHVPGGDLPRDGATGKARIGDDRNDENLIVAQLHLAFLHFHNQVLVWLATNEPELTDDDARFARAQQLTRWHYQSIVVEDFLRTVALSSVVDELLADPVGDRVTRTNPDLSTEVFMPLEHSVAAYRFGHSMVRAQYDHNENFGRPEGGDGPDRATFDQLFAFTGKGVIRGDAAQPPPAFEFARLPDNWPIRWTRFVDRNALPGRFARKIDTHLSPPLKDLSNEGVDLATGKLSDDLAARRILRRLAVRNLLRGYRLGIPTGQAVAAALGVAPLTAAELTRPAVDPQRENDEDPVRDALIDGGFVEATPLWFYVLKEAEVQGQGQHLGEVGSRIVCTTLIGQIQADETSYLRRPEGAWTPAEGVKLTDGGEVNTIRTFLQFAGVLV